MFDYVSKYWWAVLVRGIFSILFGVLAFGWPGETLAAMILLFGAWALVDGIFAFLSAFSRWQERDDRWLLFLEGLLGVMIGIITLTTPAITGIALLFYIIAWSLATGVLKIFGAVRLRHEIEGELWLALSGIASIIFAFLMLFFPAAGFMGLIWAIATYAILFGAFQIALSLKLRHLFHDRPGSIPHRDLATHEV
jgi:uncharacterized membrane protein HdeD (DUF308 family)